MKNAEEKVISLLKETMGVEGEINTSSLLIDEIGLDSIEIVELGKLINKEYGTDFSIPEMQKWNIVNDILEVVNEKSMNA